MVKSPAMGLFCLHHRLPVDAERLTKLQDFSLAKGLIQRKSPVEDLYTNPPPPHVIVL